MTAMEEYRRWLACPRLTEAERTELTAISGDAQEIRERFFAPLSFGTAGLRGVMGAGIRRMNARVVRQATRALAALILEQGGEAATKGAVVCCDCRNHSWEYAVDAARVLAACGIRVYLFESLRPTPELSFAIRQLGATAGINVTASHNPKEYNGYKVYWADGAQLPPEHAAMVAAAMEKLDVLAELPMADYDQARQQGLITLLGDEMDRAFLAAALRQSVRPGVAAQAGLSIVYTPFYGAGAKLVPEALRQLGVPALHCVTAQMSPDGNFPTAKNPNPEYEVGFEEALKLARQVGADLIIGTDPDSDRLGLMVRQADAYRLLTGNQVGVLFLDYLLETKKESGTLPENAVALKSVVSSEMARAVAEAGGVAMEDTFTGFKFLAEKMKQYENGEKTVLFAFEEAIGYAFGTFVRDKDGVTASILAAEMASYHALQGHTLLDRLEALYQRLGYYGEQTVSLTMPGVDGLEKMQALMARLRREPPQMLGGLRVTRLRDYLPGLAKRADGHTEQLDMAGADVLYFELEDDCRFIIRPSGTEPKIKCYLMARGANAADCDARLASMAQTARELAS